MSANGHQPTIVGLDRYALMAFARAEFTQADLERHRRPQALLDEIARMLEDAAGTLLYAAIRLLPAAPELQQLLAGQTGGLLAVAAKFEEAAELAERRHAPSGESDGFGNAERGTNTH